MLMTPHNPIMLAVDTPRLDEALALVEILDDSVGAIKLGLEFFMANGPKGVHYINARVPHLPLLLDVKLHDIPNTVASAMKQVPSYVWGVTVHAGGGEEMMRAAVQHAGAVRVVAVTVLTSLDEVALAPWGSLTPVWEMAAGWAAQAYAAGCGGLVCSGREVAAMRHAYPNHKGLGFALMVPGIRAAAAEQEDQKRTVTAAEAVAAGADWIVVGRPIAKAADPVAAAMALLASVREAVAVPDHNAV